MDRLLTLLILLILFSSNGNSQQLVLDYNKSARGFEVAASKKIGKDWYFIVEDGYVNGALIKTDSEQGSSSFVRRFDVPGKSDEFSMINDDVYLFSWNYFAGIDVIKYAPSTSGSTIKHHNSGSVTKAVEGNYFIIYEFRNDSFERSHHWIDDTGYKELDILIPDGYRLMGTMEAGPGTAVLFTNNRFVKAYYFMEGMETKDVSEAFNYLWDNNGGLAPVLSYEFLDDKLVIHSPGEIHFWQWDTSEDNFEIYFSEETYSQSSDMYINFSSRDVYLSNIQGWGIMTVDWFDVDEQKKVTLESVEGYEIIGAWKDNLITFYDNSIAGYPHYHYSNNESEELIWLQNDVLQSFSVGPYVLATMNTAETGTEIHRIDLQTGELINEYDLYPGVQSGQLTYLVQEQQVSKFAIDDYFFTDDKIYLFADNGLDGNNLYEYNLTNHFLQPLTPLSTCNKGADYDFFIFDETLHALSTKFSLSGYESSIWQYDDEANIANALHAIDERLRLIAKSGDDAILVSDENVYRLNNNDGISIVLSAEDLNLSELNISRGQLINDDFYFVNVQGAVPFVYRFDLNSYDFIKIDPPGNSQYYNIHSFDRLQDHLIFSIGSQSTDQIYEWRPEDSAPHTFPGFNDSDSWLYKLEPHRTINKLYFFTKKDLFADWEIWGWPNSDQDFQLLKTFPEELNIEGDFFSGKDGNIYGNGRGYSVPDYPFDSMWKFDVETNEISVPNASQSYILKSLIDVIVYGDVEYFIIEKVVGVDNYVLAKFDETFDLLHHFPDYYNDIEIQGHFGPNLLMGFRESGNPGGLYTIHVETLEFEKLNQTTQDPEEFWVTENTKKFKNQLHVVAHSGCTDLEWWRFEVEGYPTETEELPVSPSALIYPNPSSGLVNIDLPELEEARVRVFDLSGQLIKEQVIQSQGEIDLTHEVASLYFFEIDSESFTKTIRVLLLK